MHRVPVDPVSWCAGRLGSSVAAVLFESGNLSRVVGLRLYDGREVVVKVRPWANRLLGCWEAQRVASDRGFPCPRPLAKLELVDGDAVTIEEYRPGGEQLAPARDAPQLFAGLLVQLVALTPHIARLESLQPSPPWVGWDHRGNGLWPIRDDGGPGLNQVEGPAWLDDAAGRARTLLTGLNFPPVLGHGDWESQNLRWCGRRPHVVHDWDSVIAQPEPAVAGAASAVWPAAGAPGEAASVEQSTAFLEAYQDASTGRWDRRAHQAAWAAGLWVRAFNAKKDAADGGGPQLDLLAGEVAQRLRNAGL